MHLPVEDRGVRGVILPREAEDPVDFLRPEQDAAGEVVFPVTDASDPLGVFEPQEILGGLVPEEQPDLDQVVHPDQHLGEVERCAEKILRPGF